MAPGTNSVRADSPSFPARPARELEHRRREVDAHNGRTALREMARDDPRTARDVEHPIAAVTSARSAIASRAAASLMIGELANESACTVNCATATRSASAA